MALNPIRVDRTFLVKGRLSPGLYLLDDNIDRRSLPPINILKNNRHVVYTDSSEDHSIEIDDLTGIADPGDLLIAADNGSILRTYLSGRANQNSILVTEACDNLCLFCSQPPKASPSYFDIAYFALRHFLPDSIIGITGGEPTLYWDQFKSFTDNCSNLSNKYFHVLSHGRNFSDSNKVSALQENNFLSKALFGIPIHGHNDLVHDQTTQKLGSFNETLRGLIYLGYAGASIEIRIIVTKINCLKLALISQLIKSYLNCNDIFVVFMQLEPTGWAKARYSELYAKSEDFSENLGKAIDILEQARIPVYLYNFPICHLPAELRKYSKQSISDWKNYFPSECTKCIQKTKCSGYFSSAILSRLERPRPIYEEFI